MQLRADPHLPAGGAASEEPPHGLSRTRVVLTLVVLTLINVVNVMDRSLIAVLAEPIKREFALSDTQLGLLSGLAFAAVWGLLSLPISRVADRGLHRAVIMASLILWSAFTFVAGLSRAFWQLAVLRMGVAAGEAGLNPAAHALISRLFSPARRGTAIAVFSLGVPLGTALGAVVAARIAGAYGWRAAFLAIGPLGIALAPLLLVAPRAGRAGPAVRRDAGFGTRGLFADPVYRNVWIASAMTSTFSFGAGAFVAPYLIRVHGLTIAEVGPILAITGGLGVGTGAFLGGAQFDFVAKRWPGRQLYPSVIAMYASAAAALTGWLAGDLRLAVGGIAVALFFYGLTAVPTLTVAQNVAAPDRRAGASAMLGISTGLVGTSLGPLVTGALSDVFGRSYGTEGIRYALAALAGFQLAGGAFYLIAARHFSRSARTIALRPMAEDTTPPSEPV